MLGSAKDADNLANPDRAKRSENGRNSRQKIGQAVGFCGNRNYSDFASLQVLFVLHSLIKRQKDLKTRLLRQKQ
jgi:hypothetical protein